MISDEVDLLIKKLAYVSLTSARKFLSAASVMMPPETFYMFVVGRILLSVNIEKSSMDNLPSPPKFLENMM